MRHERAVFSSKKKSKEYFSEFFAAVDRGHVGAISVQPLYCAPVVCIYIHTYAYVTYAYVCVCAPVVCIYIRTYVCACVCVCVCV